MAEQEEVEQGSEQGRAKRAEQGSEQGRAETVEQVADMYNAQKHTHKDNRDENEED